MITDEKDTAADYCPTEGGAFPLFDALILVSQVTSALRPLDPAVYYLNSAGGDTFTTVSWLLLGLRWLLPVASVSAMLDDMVKRVYEVVSIEVQGWSPLWEAAEGA
jgi:hypothetical protein